MDSERVCFILRALGLEFEKEETDTHLNLCIKKDEWVIDQDNINYALYDTEWVKW